MIHSRPTEALARSARCRIRATLLRRISGLGGLARTIATAAPLEAIIASSDQRAALCCQKMPTASCGYTMDSAKLAAPVDRAAPTKSGGAGAGKLIMLEVRCFKVRVRKPDQVASFSEVILDRLRNQTLGRRKDGESLRSEVAPPPKRRLLTGLRLTRRGTLSLSG